MTDKPKRITEEPSRLSTAIERAGLLIAIGLIAVAVAVVYAARELNGPEVIDRVKIGKYDVEVTR